jgi:hypothetical protein
MNRTLIIRTPNGDFDLFENEVIVQTSGIFSLKDITSRAGEYTNEFSLPLTNNNRKLIEFADFSNSINTIPYKKLRVEIIIDELNFKTGFIEITSIDEVISDKFYDLVKSVYLNDLDWSIYDHVWNLSNAIAASENTYGYVYPVIQYGGQTTSSDIVDIRKILPGTYVKTCVDLILSKFGYSAVNNFDTSDLDLALLPYSIKNPEVSSQVLLSNSVDVGNTNNYVAIVGNRIYNNSAGFNFVTSNPATVPVNFNLINTVGSSGNYNDALRTFTAQYNGTYDYDFDCPLVSYDYIHFNFSPNISTWLLTAETHLVAIKITPSGSTIIQDVLSSDTYSERQTPGSHSTIPPITGFRPFPPPNDTIPSVQFYTSNLSGSVFLNQGEKLVFELRYKYYLNYGVSSPVALNTVVNFDPEITSASTLEINLQPKLIFGGLITYSSMLPKIKCSDFLKDICIRFGLIFAVDEDNKKITFNKIDKLTENISVAYDWTNKIDNSKKPITTFKYDNYAQSNNFKHTQDKLNLSVDRGSDYLLIINNENLDTYKDFYSSPFSASENILFNGKLTTSINLYDVNNGNFDNNVVPRITFSKVVNGLFKFTDGTTTSGYINNVVCWFIDNDVPQLSMGFGTSLIDKNSSTLIQSLQNLRIMRSDFNLNIIDVKGMDYFVPVWIGGDHNSYFFISVIKDFNYTSHQLTEVELIKLN